MAVVPGAGEVAGDQAHRVGHGRGHGRDAHGHEHGEGDEGAGADDGVDQSGGDAGEQDEGGLPPLEREVRGEGCERVGHHVGSGPAERGEAVADLHQLQREAEGLGEVLLRHDGADGARGHHPALAQQQRVGEGVGHLFEVVGDHDDRRGRPW